LRHQFFKKTAITTRINTSQNKNSDQPAPTRAQPTSRSRNPTTTRHKSETDIQKVASFSLVLLFSRSRGLGLGFGIFGTKNEKRVGSRRETKKLKRGSCSYKLQGRRRRLRRLTPRWFCSDRPSPSEKKKKNREGSEEVEKKIKIG